MAGVVFATLLIGVLAYVAFVFWRHDDMRHRFETVYQGMTTAQVLDLMGAPEIERKGCRDGQWSWKGEPVPGKTCATEFQYAAPVMFGFWTIGFDSEDIAIAKYAYISP